MEERARELWVTKEGNMRTGGLLELSVPEPASSTRRTLKQQSGESGLEGAPSHFCWKAHYP